MLLLYLEIYSFPGRYNMIGCMWLDKSVGAFSGEMFLAACPNDVQLHWTW